MAEKSLRDRAFADLEELGSRPVHHGGAVHERRHTLTCYLSPTVGWEDMDLST